MSNTIIFDLDGTLTDSSEGIFNSIRYAMEKMGYPLDPEVDLTWCLGPPLERFMAELIAPFGDDRANMAADFFRERYVSIGMYENKPYPGIMDVLTRLAAQKTLYIGTSKRRDVARKVVEYFDMTRVFKEVYGPEPQNGVIDKAEMLRMMIQEQGIDPSETTMVGDRYHDIHAAKANGLVSIGVTYGYGSVKELTDAGADRLCGSPEELITMLQ